MNTEEIPTQKGSFHKLIINYCHKHSAMVIMILVGLILIVGVLVLRVKLSPYRGLFPTDNLGR